MSILPLENPINRGEVPHKSDLNSERVVSSSVIVTGAYGPTIRRSMSIYQVYPSLHFTHLVSVICAQQNKNSGKYHYSIINFTPLFNTNHRSNTLSIRHNLSTPLLHRLWFGYDLVYYTSQDLINLEKGKETRGIYLKHEEHTRFSFLIPEPVQRAIELMEFYFSCFLSPSTYLRESTHLSISPHSHQIYTCNPHVHTRN